MSGARAAMPCQGRASTRWAVMRVSPASPAASRAATARSWAPWWSRTRAASNPGLNLREQSLAQLPEHRVDVGLGPQLPVAQPLAQHERSHGRPVALAEQLIEACPGLLRRATQRHLKRRVEGGEVGGEGLGVGLGRHALEAGEHAAGLVGAEGW